MRKKKLNKINYFKLTKKEKDKTETLLKNCNKFFVRFVVFIYIFSIDSVILIHNPDSQLIFVCTFCLVFEFYAIEVVNHLFI